MSLPSPQTRITACRIPACSTSPGHTHKIMVSYDNASEEQVLYTFFCDEKSYVASSFVGMTYGAAMTRVLDDDAKYLQSDARHMAF